MSKANQETGEKSRYQVPNLDRALSVVELLSGQPQGLNVSEIAEQLGIPKNSAFRISVTLENRGYLGRNEVTKRYRLTPKFLMLGASMVSEDNLFEKSIDVMRRLRDITKETVLLGVMLGDEGVVLDHTPGLHRFRFEVDPGTRFHLHTAAPGKAMLAALPPAESKVLVKSMAMPRFTENTITDRKVFAEHLEGVRERGYGFDLGEELEGQYCVGAAVVDAKGYPIASLWITAPSSRLPDGELDAVGQQVKAHADEVSARFGNLRCQMPVRDEA